MNTTYASSNKNSTMDQKSNIPLILPFWDDAEINRRLEEHAKLLAEWDELLTRTGAPDVNSISQHDAQRHIFLKRKLHESLGVMARIVQNQLKTKKMAVDGSISGPAPVMVTGAHSTGVYAPMGMSGGNQNITGMHLPTVNYQQGGNMDYNSSQHMSQPMQAQNVSYNNSYNYQNGFVPAAPNMNMPAQSNDMMGTYYNYNPQLNQGMQQMNNQPVSSQNMYVPQYQVPTNTSNTAHNTQGNNATTDNRSNSNGNNYSYAPAAYTAPMVYNNNTMNAQGMHVQQPPSGQANNSSYNYGNASNNNNNTAPYTAGGDGSAMMYSQQLLQQVPTSYYGNSSVANTNTAAPHTATLAHPQYAPQTQGLNQNQSQNQSHGQSHGQAHTQQQQGQFQGQHVQGHMQQGQQMQQAYVPQGNQGMYAPQGQQMQGQGQMQGQQAQGQQLQQQGQRGVAPGNFSVPAAMNSGFYDPTKDKQ